MDVQTAKAALCLIKADNEYDIKDVKPLSGGVSNLTYLLETNNKINLVMRTPPKGKRSGNAHNMVREAKVLQAVHPLFKEAPKIIGFSDDPSATGDQFMIMTQIVGKTVSPGEVIDITSQQAHHLCENFVDVIARLHDAPMTDDVMNVFGDPNGFIARQVAGWSRRIVALGMAQDRQTLIDWLEKNIPQDPLRPSILHNDYKFDNMVLDENDPTQIVGVLDWELSGLGDPFMDLGNALAYWVEKDDPKSLHGFKRGPTDIDGMMTRNEIIAAYCKKRNLTPPENMDFYQSMGLFRLAVIALQVHVRMKGSLENDGPFLNGAIALLDRAEYIAGV